MKYILPLVDAQGQTVHIEAYGIDQITSDIESLSTENLANLFKGVSKDDIMRSAGPVDVLIGYEYAAYHPQRTQNVGHLLLPRIDLVFVSEEHTRILKNMTSVTLECSML